MWYMKHSGNGLSDENWSNIKNVINRKPECRTVKHNYSGLPGGNKGSVIKSNQNGLEKHLSNSTREGEGTDSTVQVKFRKMNFC